MTIEELSAEERDIVMYAIRQFGEGGHPYPDELNINFFASEFASQCLDRVLKRAKLGKSEQEQIKTIIAKLR